jgi:hypothetical protein
MIGIRVTARRTIFAANEEFFEPECEKRVDL